jgi:hypothetical protein
MPDEPHTPDEFLEVLQRLTSQQTSALERLLERDGQSCGISGQYTKSLADRDLIVQAVDPLTQGWRVCASGCGHLWYAIPEAVREAYSQWSAQWEDGGEAAAPREAPSAPPAARPLVVRRPEAPLWWARIMNPIYGSLELFGTRYDQGQLLTLPEDVTEMAAIVRLEYVQKAPPEKAYLRAECGVCQAWFLNEHFRDKHGALRHQGRFASDLDMAVGMEGPLGVAALRDTTGDAADRRQWVEYPPNLEKSRASQQG